MISSETVISLLEAIKKNDQGTLDHIIRKLIKEAERKGYHQIAKKLREIYAEPYSPQINKGSGSLSSSFSSSTITSGANLYELRKSKVGLKDVILSKKNEQLANEIIETFRNKDKLKKLDLQYENNVFVYGSPGTGKTLFAYALAGELELPVLHVYLDSLISSYLGETGKNLGKIFSDANKNECVLFLDEFDAIGKMRDDNQDLGELKRVVVVLLQQIDEMNSNSILVAATNHDHLIDKAIRRRFNYEMHLDLLDLEGRARLIDLYLRKFARVDSKLLSEVTDGMSGSTIRQNINKALKNWYLGGSKNDLSVDLVDKFAKHFLSETKFDTKNESQMKTFTKLVQKLRSFNPKKYTFKSIESMTKMPDSTIFSILEKYGN